MEAVAVVRQALAERRESGTRGNAGVIKHCDA